VTDRRLVLLRHAKAEGFGRTDADRVLAPKGRRDAAAVGRWLASQDVIPDLAVVSPASRAGETWDLAAAELGAEPPVTVDDRVYANSTPELLAIVAGTAGDVASLVLVGHNPSIGQLASSLDDGTGDPAVREELAHGFPTAAVSVFALADWTARTGRLVAYAVPRG
jgi:phosphohistidine phosphatase